MSLKDKMIFNKYLKEAKKGNPIYQLGTVIASVEVLNKIMARRRNGFRKPPNKSMPLLGII